MLDFALFNTTCLLFWSHTCGYFDLKPPPEVGPCAMHWVLFRRMFWLENYSLFRLYERNLRLSGAFIGQVWEPEIPRGCIVAGIITMFPTLNYDVFHDFTTFKIWVVINTWCTAWCTLQLRSWIFFFYYFIIYLFQLDSEKLIKITDGPNFGLALSMWCL